MTEQTEALDAIDCLHAHARKTAATDSFYQSHNAEMDEHMRTVSAAIHQQAERIAELEAQLARAEEVIRPFSEEAEMWSPEENAGHDCGSDYSINGECSDLTVGHLRAAAQWIKEHDHA